MKLYTSSLRLSAQQDFDWLAASVCGMGVAVMSNMWGLLFNENERCMIFMEMDKWMFAQDIHKHIQMVTGCKPCGKLIP